MKAAATSDDDVPIWLHFLGWLVDRHPRSWLAMGRLESSRLAVRLDRVTLRAPIYICGLARSGSTLLHEAVSSYPGMATHRVKDYPLVFTPYWWRRGTAGFPPQAPRERPHRDGVMITAESPDALEEMLWMAFFPSCHDPAIPSVLSASDRNARFESFYAAHVRKLLLAEGAVRYAAKDNYHVARLAYLLGLFPDARFLIPVRSPTAHVASLARQHAWFSQVHRRHPRTLAYMQRSGHFEFGLDRRPLNLGSAEKVRHIVEAWAAGDEVRGLAIYWDMVYGYLAELLAGDPQVRRASLVVRFESLCERPRETLQDVFEHCELSDAAETIDRLVPRIRPPSYYQCGFSPGDLDVIHRQTAATAGLWGY